MKLTKENSRATTMVEQPQDPLDYRPDDEELHNGCGECNGRRSYRCVGDCSLTTVKLRPCSPLDGRCKANQRSRQKNPVLQRTCHLRDAGLKGRLRMVSQRREGPDLQGAEGDHGVERALSFRSSTFPQGL